MNIKALIVTILVLAVLLTVIPNTESGFTGLGSTIGAGKRKGRQINSITREWKRRQLAVRAADFLCEAAKKLECSSSVTT